MAGFNAVLTCENESFDDVGMDVRSHESMTVTIQSLIYRLIIYQVIF